MSLALHVAENSRNVVLEICCVRAHPASEKCIGDSRNRQWIIRAVKNVENGPPRADVDVSVVVAVRCLRQLHDGGRCDGLSDR